MLILRFVLLGRRVITGFVTSGSTGLRPLSRVSLGKDFWVIGIQLGIESLGMRGTIRSGLGSVAGGLSSLVSRSGFL